LRKSGETRRLDFVLCLGLESIRIAGVLLGPIVPALSDCLLGRLAATPAERTWESCTRPVWSVSDAVHSIRQSEATRRALSEEKVVLYRKIKV
jgi:methionyl-tRNA synthetase